MGKNSKSRKNKKNINIHKNNKKSKSKKKNDSVLTVKKKNLLNKYLKRFVIMNGGGAEADAAAEVVTQTQLSYTNKDGKKCLFNNTFFIDSTHDGLTGETVNDDHGILHTLINGTPIYMYLNNKLEKIEVELLKVMYETFYANQVIYDNKNEIQKINNEIVDVFSYCKIMVSASQYFDSATTTDFSKKKNIDKYFKFFKMGGKDDKVSSLSKNAFTYFNCFPKITNSIIFKTIKGIFNDKYNRNKLLEKDFKAPYCLSPKLFINDMNSFIFSAHHSFDVALFLYFMNINEDEPLFNKILNEKINIDEKESNILKNLYRDLIDNGVFNTPPPQEQGQKINIQNLNTYFFNEKGKPVLKEQLQKMSLFVLNILWLHVLEQIEKDFIIRNNKCTERKKNDSIFKYNDDDDISGIFNKAMNILKNIRFVNFVGNDVMVKLSNDYPEQMSFKVSQKAVANVLITNIGDFKCEERNEGKGIDDKAVKMAIAFNNIINSNDDILDINKPTIKMFIARILKYSGDTSHIVNSLIIREALIFLMGIDNKAVIENKILLSERPLSYRVFQLYENPEYLEEGGINLYMQKLKVYDTLVKSKSDEISDEIEYGFAFKSSNYTELYTTLFDEINKTNTNNNNLLNIYNVYPANNYDLSFIDSLNEQTKNRIKEYINFYNNFKTTIIQTTVPDYKNSYNTLINNLKTDTTYVINDDLQQDKQAYYNDIDFKNKKDNIEKDFINKYEKILENLGEKINDIITKYGGKTYKQTIKQDALNNVIGILDDFKTNYIDTYRVEPVINTDDISNNIIHFKNKIEFFKGECGKFDKKNAGKYFSHIIGLVNSLITNIDHYTQIYIEKQLGGASQSNIPLTSSFPPPSPPPPSLQQMKKTPNYVKNILDMIYNLKIKFRDININHQYFLLNLNDNTEKSSILKRQFTYFPTGKKEAEILKDFDSTFKVINVDSTFQVNADELEQRSKTNKKWSYSVETYFKDIKYVNEIYKILVEYDSCIKFCDEINKLDPNFSFNNLKEILNGKKREIIQEIYKKIEIEPKSFINELIDNYNINELIDNYNINELNDNSNSNVITILKNIYNNHEIHSIIENVEFIVENITKEQEPTGGQRQKRKRKVYTNYYGNNERENENENENPSRKRKKLDGITENNDELYNKLEYQINSDFQELEQFNLEQQFRPLPFPPYYNCIYARLMMNMLFIIDNTFTEEEKYSFINYYKQIIDYYKDIIKHFITDFETNNKETQINYINYIISEYIDEDIKIIDDENTLYDFYNSIKDTYFVYDNIYGVKVFKTRHLDIIRNDNEYISEHIEELKSININDMYFNYNLNYKYQKYKNILSIIDNHIKLLIKREDKENMRLVKNKINKNYKLFKDSEKNFIEYRQNNFIKNIPKSNNSNNNEGHTTTNEISSNENPMLPNLSFYPPRPPPQQQVILNQIVDSIVSTIHKQRMNYIIHYANNIINKHNINKNIQEKIFNYINDQVYLEFLNIIKYNEFLIEQYIKQNINIETITNHTRQNIINYTIKNIPPQINELLNNTSEKYKWYIIDIIKSN